MDRPGGTGDCLCHEHAGHQPQPACAGHHAVEEGLHGRIMRLRQWHALCCAAMHIALASQDILTSTWPVCTTSSHCCAMKISLFCCPVIVLLWWIDPARGKAYRDELLKLQACFAMAGMGHAHAGIVAALARARRHCIAVLDALLRFDAHLECVCAK